MCPPFPFNARDFCFTCGNYRCFETMPPVRMQRTRKRQNERKLWRKQSDGIGRFLFCPHFLHLSLDLLRPFAMGVYLSFCKFTTVTDAKFIGFSNYLKIFTDASFVHALWYTAIFTVVTVVLINVLAFAVALLLTKDFGGQISSGQYFLCRT